MSEYLSRLRRDQLQKFAQYLICELPQHVRISQALGFTSVVSLDKRLYFTLSLFTEVYKWVLAIIMLGGNLVMD